MAVLQNGKRRTRRRASRGRRRPQKSPCGGTASALTGMHRCHSERSRAAAEARNRSHPGRGNPWSGRVRFLASACAFARATLGMTTGPSLHLPACRQSGRRWRRGREGGVTPDSFERGDGLGRPCASRGRSKQSTDRRVWADGVIPHGPSAAFCVAAPAAVRVLRLPFGETAISAFPRNRLVTTQPPGGRGRGSAVGGRMLLRRM